MSYVISNRVHKFTRKRHIFEMFRFWNTQIPKLSLHFCIHVKNMSDEFKLKNMHNIALKIDPNNNFRWHTKSYEILEMHSSVLASQFIWLIIWIWRDFFQNMKPHFLMLKMAMLSPLLHWSLDTYKVVPVTLTKLMNLYISPIEKFLINPWN